MLMVLPFHLASKMAGSELCIMVYEWNNGVNGPFPTSHLALKITGGELWKMACWSDFPDDLFSTPNLALKITGSEL